MKGNVLYFLRITMPMNSEGRLYEGSGWRYLVEFTFNINLSMLLYSQCVHFKATIV